MAAILDEKIFCCHGGKGRESGMQFVLPGIGQHHFWHLHICWCFLALGLSPDLQSMEQIRRIMRPTDVPDQGMCCLTILYDDLLTYDTGLLCDLLWADPDKETMGWGENDRGVSFTFGPEIVSKFLAKHDLDLICRAHQVTGALLCCSKHLPPLPPSRWWRMVMSSLLRGN